MIRNQGFPACVEDFGSSVAVYLLVPSFEVESICFFSLCPLCSQKYHIVARFCHFLWSFSCRFTALFIFTNLDHRWGVSVVSCGQRKAAAAQSGSQLWFLNRQTLGLALLLLCSLVLSGPAYLLKRWCCFVFGYECFSLSLVYSLWQCNIRVWITLLFIFEFIWVHNGAERWVRCRFFLAR